MHPLNQPSPGAPIAVAAAGPPSRGVPPKLWVGRSPSMFFGGMLLALVALGGGAVVFFFDPTQTPFYPQCAFHNLTGLNCPGCGATRAVYALLHGRWLVALRDNALFLLTGVALALRAGYRGLDHLRHRPLRTWVPTSALIPWLVVALFFGVMRNLPMFSFLSPAK